MAGNTATAEPRLRVVDDQGIEDAEVIGTTMPTEQSSVVPQPQHPAVTPQANPSPNLIKQLAFEAALFGVGGATAGVLAASARKRPKGALLGSMGSIGIYGLYRASLGGQYLPTLHRAALGVVGVALLAGSGYLAYFHRPAAPARALTGAKKPPTKQPKPKQKTKARRRVRHDEED